MEYIEMKTLSVAVDSIEVTEFFLKASLDDTQKLRWAVSSAHQATQDFIVAALASYAVDGTLTTKGSRSKQLAKYQRELKERGIPSGPPPKAQASLLELYETLKNNQLDSQKRRNSNNKPFASTTNDDLLIHRLNELRNDFTHYTPGSQSISAHYAIEAIGAGNRVIQFIIDESHLIEWSSPVLETSAVKALRSVEETYRILRNKHSLDEWLTVFGTRAANL